ncbi:glycosyltransferase [Heterostelium album PN500]|uniref:Dolichyl-phosphate beta-glucosyltransferase n=1 Tax=Heterostelium pallidum (strain ATCC 26659 / Pp 5 / PN500) TaxID=670386 RepID=D3BEQ8_HETP5|nr:glycosyltransferase [Heterostelium album PN500]EFA80389.1 glycosyltransferase [Heterostelium album PN500]|eukprot:XP_020432509.1 glycosyltransferase [Heterostelium album PN500]
MCMNYKRNLLRSTEKEGFESKDSKIKAVSSFEGPLWLANENVYIDPKDKSEVEFPSIKDKDSLYLSLIVPAYNEQDRLPTMLDETLRYLKQKSKKDLKFSYEIIIVDDGSKDKTSEIVSTYIQRESVDKIRLLKLKKNRGKGGAIKRGMLCARGKYCLMVDADGATDINDFDRVEDTMKQIEKKGQAIVCGSRSHLIDSDVVAKRSALRNILMYGFHLFVETLCVKGIKDTQCGFKLFSRDTVKVVFSNLHIERWAFDVELLFIAQQLNIPISEVAVNWTEIDGSKLDPFSSSIQMAKDILRIRLRYLFRIWTLKK